MRSRISTSSTLLSSNVKASTMEDLLAEVKVLQQCRTSESESQRVLIVADGSALLGREDRAVTRHLMGLTSGPGVVGHHRRCARPHSAGGTRRCTGLLRCTALLRRGFLGGGHGSSF